MKTLTREQIVEGVDLIWRNGLFNPEVIQGVCIPGQSDTVWMDEGKATLLDIRRYEDYNISIFDEVRVDPLRISQGFRSINRGDLEKIEEELARERLFVLAFFKLTGRSKSGFLSESIFCALAKASPFPGGGSVLTPYCTQNYRGIRGESIYKLNLYWIGGLRKVDDPV